MRPSEIFSQRLKEARTRRNWTQDDLSRRVTELGHGLDRATVAKIERAERRVTVDDAVALAAAVGLPLLSLLVPDEGEDVEVTPEVRLRSRLALAWMEGQLPLRREDVEPYRAAAQGGPLARVPYFDTDLPRLLSEQAPRPEETEALRAHIAQERADLHDSEQVARRLGSPAMEDDVRRLRDRLVELEQLVPATPTTTAKAKSRTTTIAATKGKKTIRAKTPKRTTKEKT